MRPSRCQRPSRRGGRAAGAGRGATPEATAAALKAHVSLDLYRGMLQGPLLTEGRTHDRQTPLAAAPTMPGSLRLADLGFFDLGFFDLGFFDLRAFAQIAAQDGYWLSRLHVLPTVPARLAHGV